MRIYYSNWYTDHRYDEIFMPSSIRDVLAPRLFALAGKQTNNKLLISLTIIKYSVICLCIRHVQHWGTKNIHSQNTIKLNSTSFKVVAMVFASNILYWQSQNENIPSLWQHRSGLYFLQPILQVYELEKLFRKRNNFLKNTYFWNPSTDAKTFIRWKWKG